VRADTADVSVARARRILRATLGCRRARHGWYYVAGSGIAVESLSGYTDLPIIRVRYRAGELTIHEREVTAVAIWLIGLAYGEHDGRMLPVPEYWEPPWGPDYRWTIRAERSRRP
jgi:hypothetical protein